MKVLIDSYNTVYQRGGGGIPMRINNIYSRLLNTNVEVKLFNKWKDKLADNNILHVFKANIDSYSEIVFAKESGIKVVLSSVVPQEGEFKILFGLLLKKLFKLNNTYSYLKLILLLSDAIIAQTKKESDFIAKHYKIPLEKIHIIPNGVDDAIVRSYDTTITKDIVLCVGRFDCNKNQLNLIKAMKGTDVPVHFVGGPIPDEKDYYDTCIKEAEGYSNFVFHGWLKQGSEELIKLFQRAKVSVLISYREIFGNAFVEGAAAGANVVVTSALPVSEYGFKEGVYIVNPADIISIKESIVKAFEDNIPQSLRETAIELYSWDSVIKKHIKLYESIC